MAKKYYKAPLHQTGTQVTTKTHFGSTADMVVDHTAYIVDGNPLTIQDNEVVCKDDKGFYITLKSRVDNGLADPNRYANEKSRLLLSEKTEKESST